MTPEFSRSIPIGRIAPPGQEVEVVAEETERAALAARFGLLSIPALACAFRLVPEQDGTVMAEGHLRARIEQVCVVSTDPFESDIAEDFLLRFVAEAEVSEDIDPDDPVDLMPMLNDSIDLGEAAAEQLALVLDPYPRKPGAVPPDFDAAPRESPFAWLLPLRTRH
jgi:uncharacterized metal-binding protein YceD (DUF177 family)